MRFKLIIATVKTDVTDRIVEAAKEADPPPDPNIDPVASAAWTQRQEIARQQREEQQAAYYQQQQHFPTQT